MNSRLYLFILVTKKNLPQSQHSDARVKSELLSDFYNINRILYYGPPADFLSLMMRKPETQLDFQIQGGVCTLAVEP